MDIYATQMDIDALITRLGGDTSPYLFPAFKRTFDAIAIAHPQFWRAYDLVVHMSCAVALLSSPKTLLLRTHQQLGSSC